MLLNHVPKRNVRKPQIYNPLPPLPRIHPLPIHTPLRIPIPLPQHHIHSIVDDGVYTIIKVRKQLTQTSDDKYIELRDVVQEFLRGTATICDLEKTIEELEGDDE